MTRVFLAAGVAALAISAPASAQRGDDKRDRERAEKVERQGSARERVRAERPQRAERAAAQQRVERRAERPQRVERAAAQQRVERRAERPQRTERAAAQQRVERRAERPQRMEGVQAQREERVQRIERRADRPARQAVADRIERRTDRVSTDRQQMRADRIDRIDRTVRTDAPVAARVEQRIERARERALTRNDPIARRVAAFRDASDTFEIAPRARGRALINGCPPGLWLKNNGCMPPGQAAKLLGAPLSSVRSVATLSALPSSLTYLYPDTDDYYYRYGNGYLYQVDRSDDLIMALLPLIAGGFIPGQYLPASYMSSYVPNYYGLSSFYPDSPYSCNRYHDGVIYQVDCVTGMIEGVVPLYASGYGVGQMLPSAYSYYNVPWQYRSLYYDNDDYGYWYGPGAIYQYDQGSSLITSIAALLSPGFTVGQPLPMGYNVYNVPYAYRTNYYDTPNDWYRYNNGSIYRVDPTTLLVTAIVASVLT